MELLAIGVSIGRQNFGDECFQEAHKGRKLLNVTQILVIER